MKRVGHLWSQIIEFENLLISARKAQKGKRFRPNVLDFNYHLETELLALQRALQDQSYRPGPYRTFEIWEPKPRMISAAPYVDRVVHHALCNVIAPLCEQGFIPHSYATRKGYGSHRALRQFTRWSRSHRYVLQCDVRRYFPSIDHGILKAMIRRRIKCPKTIWLTELLIDGSNPQEMVLNYFPGDTLLTPLERRHGLPIGNLTSQFLANLYLNSLDHFVTEKLCCGSYLRYVDDFALFSDDVGFLEQARVAIEAHLATLRLRIHPVKSQCFRTSIGANFVGFRVFADRIRVRNDNLRRGRARLKALHWQYRQGRTDRLKLRQSVQSWGAHLRHGNTWRLRQDLQQQPIFEAIRLG
jgi:RNA-directed DNA polymerase